ncbi:hypothetical protein AMAG_01396 [Allomyces macrogynus ATCC 38327]|uniref:Uncharacterized protein n=1 Tax=Allomyces macrogynus (strain ATCC 38327) TaxID=578462 RepID=A0A0L0RYU4_ALLM3|nr:hypothetical protein AMAG_01396 [Allomyces macrogynus ATCC 38327]|eukprot:KNE55508.1 hypothetical protein AMAG_01396 [Allomyces macrogynus ATCC 38327]
MHFHEINDHVIEQIVVHEALLAAIFSTLISSLCILASLRMFRSIAGARTRDRSGFAVLLLIESAISLGCDLLNLIGLLVMVANQTTKAAPLCSPTRVTFDALNHLTLSIHLTLGLVRAGIFQPLFIASSDDHSDKGHGDDGGHKKSQLARCAWFRSLRPRGWRPRVPLDPAAAHGHDLMFAVVGFVLEHLRRVLVLGVVIGYPTVKTMSLVFGCREFGPALSDVTESAGAAAEYWSSAFKFCSATLLVVGLLLALCMSMGLHVLRGRRELYTTVHGAIYVFRHLDQCLWAQVYRVVLLVVGAIIFPQLPLYLGMTLLSFALRIHLALQIAYFRSLAKLLTHSAWLREQLLGPGAGAAIACDPPSMVPSSATAAVIPRAHSSVTGSWTTAVAGTVQAGPQTAHSVASVTVREEPTRRGAGHASHQHLQHGQHGAAPAPSVLVSLPYEKTTAAGLGKDEIRGSAGAGAR